jgi:mono/diheme cytochrome c family protein
VQRPKATKHELADAIDAILAGGEVKVPHAPAAGCRLTRTRAKAAAPSVTFTKHVAPVLQARCQECHRPGEAGPFPLLTFRDAADWADMIREVVDDGRMPPWHADPSVGKFRNERRLTEAEKRTLLDWVDQGCPEGDPADLPSPRVFAEGWRVGKPDLVVRMNDKLDVPATAPKNGVPYRYVYAGEPFREDTWVKAAEARPDARAVVHHILVFAVPPNPRLPADAPAEQLLGASFRGDDPDGFGQNLLAAYVPGDQPLVLPAGTAKKIAKGSRLVFEMHYTPDGKAREDRSSVGLVLAKGPPEHEVKTRAIANTDFTLVPLAGDQRVKSSTTFTRPTVLLSLSPHMHLRGKAFEYAAVPPGGEAERLLSVPKYDFNWQTPYVLAEPRRLPKGTRIDCVGRFDNSARNASNPNPWAVVRWGEQTWDEMMIGFVEYYEE